MPFERTGLYNDYYCALVEAFSERRVHYTYSVDCEDLNCAKTFGIARKRCVNCASARSVMADEFPSSLPTET